MVELCFCGLNSFPEEEFDFGYVQGTVYFGIHVVHIG